MAKNSSKVLAERTPRSQREGGYESHTVTVEPIDNGYLITESYSSEGEYHCTKVFSPDRPPANPPPSRSEGVVSTSSLRDAIAAVKGR